MGVQYKIKGYLMAKEKRIKTKRVMVRVDNELYEAFTQYVKRIGVTKTKVIDDFLKELLKNELGR